jgi:hypothetical protein
MIDSIRQSIFIYNSYEKREGSEKEKEPDKMVLKAIPTN